MTEEIHSCGSPPSSTCLGAVALPIIAHYRERLNMYRLIQEGIPGVFYSVKGALVL